MEIVKQTAMCPQSVTTDTLAEKCTRPGDLANFNISVSAADAFMQAVADDREFELVHDADPGDEILSTGACRHGDALWVYRSIPARRLFAEIMDRTYAHGNPGIVFIGTMNRENNLRYLEDTSATNPCGEQPHPAYGCCCLGSLDLTRFVLEPFSSEARFDYRAFADLVPLCVRMLDNVLDESACPLEQQKHEAAAKRRMPHGSIRDYPVQDHTYRLFRSRFGEGTALPEAFVTATEIGAEAHLAMVATVAPYIDSSISKTVNVSASYPFEDLEGLYRYGWEQGLKSVATFRPTTTRESALSSTERPRASPAKDVEESAPAQQISPDQTRGYCPTCGGLTLEKIGGCAYCGSCGYEQDCG